MLTRDQILEAHDLKVEEVQVPEWGGSVMIATMSGSARDALEQAISGGKVQNLRAKLLTFAAVDKDGNRIFKDDDIEALGRKSAVALERCIKVAQRLNRLTDADLEEAKGN